MTTIYVGYVQKSRRHNYWIQTTSENLDRVRLLMNKFVSDFKVKYPGNAWEGIILQSNSDEKHAAEYPCNHDFGNQIVERLQ